MIYRLVIDPQQICDRIVTLRSEQQHYLRRVLRLNEGDRFLAMNGTGKVWIAQLEQQQAQLLQELSASTELPIAITLIVALPKGKGFEDIIRGTTELGVNTLMPVISDRTLLQPSPHKVQRWQKIAAEAAEQSERQIVPQVLDPLPFTQALKEAEQFSAYRYICATRREDPHLLDSLPFPLSPSLVMATGCEGGWSSLELEKAIASQFVPVSLGRRILRAVTAPVAVLSCLVGELERDRTVLPPS